MSRIPVYFHSEDTLYSLRRKTLVREWIIKVIASKNRKPGEINFIFCSDKYLHKINLTYLKQDTYTDTITFDYNPNPTLPEGEGAPAHKRSPVPMGRELGGVAGDIFISIERVKENAKEFNTNFTDELHRVMVHGILHLLGYKDKTHAQKVIMIEKEDFCLSLLSFDK